MNERYYPVLITEHLQTYVNVKADSLENAATKALEMWSAGNIHINKESFTGMEVNATGNGNRIKISCDHNGHGYIERGKQIENTFSRRAQHEHHE